MEQLDLARKQRRLVSWERAAKMAGPYSTEFKAELEKYRALLIEIFEGKLSAEQATQLLASAERRIESFEENLRLRDGGPRW